MKKLSLTLSRNILLTLYKTFVRPILDYRYITNLSLSPLETNQKWSNIMQHLLLLVPLKVNCVTAFTESSVQNPLLNRDGYEIFFFHKTINGLLPVYLQSSISYCGEGVCRTRLANQKNLRPFSIKTKIFESSFFPYCIKEWNNFCEELRKIKSDFIRLKENSIFKIHDINGIELLNRPRLHFSHLNEHKFRQHFRATIDPTCSCAIEPETTLH